MLVLSKTLGNFPHRCLCKSTHGKTMLSTTAPPRKGGKNTARLFMLMKLKITISTIPKSTVSNLLIFFPLGEN